MIFYLLLLVDPEWGFFPSSLMRWIFPFSFFGGGPAEEEEKILKGDDVIVELEATLEDLYMGGSLKVCLALLLDLPVAPLTSQNHFTCTNINLRLLFFSFLKKTHLW